jgi:YVTN family beta-propeller protein
VKRSLVALLVLGLTGCSAGASHPDTAATVGSAGTDTSRSSTAAGAAAATGSTPSKPHSTPLAVVTAETEHALLVVSPATGHVLRHVRVPGEPTTLAAGQDGPVVVCSPTAGVVTVLGWPDLRTIRILHAFHRPEIAAVSPDGRWALVSDAAGTVSTIQLSTGRIIDRVSVGAGAHHMTISPDQHRAWVALGETATTIVQLDTTRPDHLHVLGRLHPRLAAHDLAFAPDGRTVWVTSATAPVVTVFDATTGRQLTTIPAGTAPQHVAFSRPPAADAYISSGYGRSLELVDTATHRVTHRAATPYGSFNLATLGDLVATTSLLDGKVTFRHFTSLHLRLLSTVAPEAREIVLLRE